MKASTDTAPKKSPPPTAVAVAQPAGEIATYDPALVASWGGGQQIDAADVLVPKMLIMQPVSEWVGEGKHQQGALVRSTDGVLLGGKKGQEDVMVPFIALSYTKDWSIFKKDKNDTKFMFQRREPFTAMNRDREWAWMRDGVAWRADQNINLFALLPSDIERNLAARKRMADIGEMPDPSDALIPIQIQFTRTSFKVGRGVVTHFAQSQDMGIPAAMTTLSVYTEMVKGDGKLYFVFKLGAQSKTSPTHLAIARKWYDILSRSQVRVHEEDIIDAEVAAPASDMDDGRF